MKRKILLTASLFLSCVLLFACGGSFGKITKISFAENYSFLTLSEGETSEDFVFTVSTNGKAFTFHDFIFSSDNPSVAFAVFENYHENDGIVFNIRAVGAGTAYIHFETVDGNVVSPTIKVTVVQAHTQDETTTLEPSATGEENTQSTTAEEDEPSPQAEIAGENVGETVYVTPHGKKYHSSAKCAGKNATEISLEEAKKSYSPCKRCVH